jgi:hypothetical protein
MKDLVGEEGILGKLEVENKASIDTREEIDCDVLDKGKHRDVLFVDALIVHRNSQDKKKVRDKMEN